MCIVCYAIVIDVTARLYFFFQSKRGVYRLGGMGMGVIYDLRTMFLVLMPVPLVFLLLCLFHHR